MASFTLNRALPRTYKSTLHSPYSQSLCTRSFSTTPCLPVKAREQVKGRYGNIPPYPYGYRPWYKKSNFGLFGNLRVRFGNNVSERNEIKTRRRWHPNVHRKRLYSIALGRMVRVKVVTRVMRTIDKVGGLDEYLLGEKAGRIKELGPGGWALRWRIMRTDAVKERMAREREALGLPPKGTYVSAATGESVEVVNEEDVGMTEAELQAREASIDKALDEDMAKDEQGVDGGVELESLESEKEPVPQESQQPKRRKW